MVTRAQLRTVARTRRVLRELEHDHQCALMQWVAVQAAAMPELRLLFAVPNGGKRGIVTAQNLKAEGVRKGVPDLMLPVGRRGYLGLFIELKRPDGRNPKAEQADWLRDLTAQGYHAVCCKGWEEAAKAILWYLQGGKTEAYEVVSGDAA